MPITVNKDYQGPDWPLGNIIVTVPGTPVRMTSLVDPTGVNAPGTSNRTPGAGVLQYTPRGTVLCVQGFKAGANGLVTNVGNIYIVRSSGNRDDYGQIVACLLKTETLWLPMVSRGGQFISPYRYYVDADNANDGCQCTLWM